MAGQLDKRPVSNRMTRANVMVTSNVTKSNGRRVERHPWPQDAVLGMDVRTGDGDLFGEARENEGTDQEEEVSDFPYDEADQARVPRLCRRSNWTRGRDYLFVSRKNILRKDELEGEDEEVKKKCVKVLVVKNLKHK